MHEIAINFGQHISHYVDSIGIEKKTIYQGDIICSLQTILCVVKIHFILAQKFSVRAELRHSIKFYYIFYVDNRAARKQLKSM